MSRFISRHKANLTFGVGLVATALIFWVSGWNRRWIADDGLIVLRTVRNLLAGHGPVFNLGERVEANTSTVWTYLVTFLSWITQARLEYVVLGVALALSALAAVFAMLGARLLWTGTTSTALLLPAGMLVYIAIPPARDYVTSGLETSLVICWIAAVWWLLLRWIVREEPRISDVMVLGFVAGLGPLVRPEMTLVAVLVLGVIFLAPTRRFWLDRALLVAISGAIPVGYQLLRMGYYALPYPNTALAKDAAGAKWEQGWRYLHNTMDPYVLWLPIAVLAIVGIIGWIGRSRNLAPTRVRLTDPSSLTRKLRSRAVAVGIVVSSGLVLGIYVLRVGGDFMHGRVLLPSLFLLLLPVAVLPIQSVALRRENWRSAVAFGGWAVAMIWVVVIANMGQLATATTIGRLGVVDERAYYIQNTGHAHPIRAEDYLDFPRMRAMVRVLHERADLGTLVIPLPTYTDWAQIPRKPEDVERRGKSTVYFLNLGMTSMNVPLKTRVIDQMGLAYPIAAHTERLKNGRIGHDKNLPAEWVVADEGYQDVPPGTSYLLPTTILEAKGALDCQDLRRVLDSTGQPLTPKRFVYNILHAMKYANYRIDRLPQYALRQCGLDPVFPWH